MKARMWNVVGVVMLLTLVAVPLSVRTTPGRTAAAPSADKVLGERIAHRLKGDASTKKYDVDVAVDAGVATLTGTVVTVVQKAQAARLAHVTGITRIDNRIVVDPAARARRTIGKIGPKP